MNEKLATEEQNRVIYSKANTLSVNAGAGCGKSFVLERYARQRPKEKFICLAYNKSISVDAAMRFAGAHNVSCMTTHAIAYNLVGKKYGSSRDKESGKVGETSVVDISRKLGVSLKDAILATKVVKKFMSSSLQEIGEQCGGVSVFGKESDLEKKARIFSLANTIWGKMIDDGDASIKIPHDGYLKLMSINIKDYEFGYDVVLLDEAQDTSDAVCRMIDEIGVRRVMAGDKHQSINGWRGAVNAMSKFDSDENLYLTSSYRFGPGIAGVANALLTAKGEKHLLSGKGGGGQSSGSLTIICRTNAKLLDNAIKLASMGKKIGFVGGFDAYRFGKILDVWRVAYGSGATCTDKFLGSFESLDELEVHAKMCIDIELMQVVSFVKKHGTNVPGMIKSVKDLESRHLKNADIIMCTAHSSKGLEFDNVVLDEDFYDMNKYSPSATEEIQEEVNLIYVACTRARRKLNTSKQLGLWLNRSF